MGRCAIGARLAEHGGRLREEFFELAPAACGEAAVEADRPSGVSAALWDGTRIELARGFDAETPRRALETLGGRAA
jgi:hypothetical protein